MIHGIIATVLAVAITASPTPKKEKKPEWKSLGEYRTTFFCEACNSPYGRQSASGIPLEYGHVAMNDVPLGSKINIEGETFIVTDRCGIDRTVDIFVPTCDGMCHCNKLDYEVVKIRND